MYEIKRLVTIHDVSVDSVCSNVWDSHKGGIQTIVPTDNGVRINWNQGSTFIPWANVRFLKEGF